MKVRDYEFPCTPFIKDFTCFLPAGTGIVSRTGYFTEMNLPESSVLPAFVAH